MFAKGKRILTKHWVLFLLVPAILLTVTGGVFAFLTAITPKVTNWFDPVVVTCRVEEEFDGNAKQNVSIRNTGDISGFIRATLVINWVDADGKVLAAAPVESVDYTAEWGSNLWQMGSDGYWYYTKAVSPGETTDLLLKSLTPGTAPEGYRLQVQILATAIQAEPVAAVESAWGADVTADRLTPP